MQLKVLSPNSGEWKACEVCKHGAQALGSFTCRALNDIPVENARTFGGCGLDAKLFDHPAWVMPRYQAAQAAPHLSRIPGPTT